MLPYRYATMRPCQIVFCQSTIHHCADHVIHSFRYTSSIRLVLVPLHGAPVPTTRRERDAGVKHGNHDPEREEPLTGTSPSRQINYAVVAYTVCPSSVSSGGAPKVSGNQAYSASFTPR